MGDKQVDFSVVGFKSYLDYLLSFTNRDDVRYLTSKNVAASLVKLGYRSTKVPYDEKEYVKRVDLAMQALRPVIKGDQPYSIYMSPDNTDPVLLEFKKREQPNFRKSLATIVFTSYTDVDGAEISGYLDLEMSWSNAMRRASKHTNWKGVYEGRARLHPMSHHLSYHNQKYSLLLYTDSDNFSVVHDRRYGLMFEHKGDHRYISVGGLNNPYTANARRSMVHSPKYGTMIFYDHVVRKKV